jgi:EmrB/QacA subfamily drug resistance transporter
VSRSTSSPVLIALLVAGAFFMENLDGTVIATALPQMAISFGVHPVDLNLGMSAYLLTLAVFIPVSGWVADRFGARTVFTGAIAVFTLASVLCGFSVGLWSFTAARVLQGIGGAMMVPVGRLVVLRSTEKKDLMRSIAYITWPGLAAPVLGPPVGGFITDYASWHWIFFLNVPLGLLGIIFSLMLIPNARPDEKRPFDTVGFVLSGMACVAIMLGLDLVGQQGTNWTAAGLLMASGVGLGALGVRHMRRHSHPLLSLAALRIQTYAVSTWGGSLFRISISMVPFLLPLMFQVGFGMSAFASGLLVLAVFAGNLGMKPATSPVLRRFGFKRVLLGNGLIAAASLAACGLLEPETPKALVIVILFIGGLARSMQFTAIATLSFADVPQAQMSSANSLGSVVQQLTMGMGIAAGALALRAGAVIRGESAAKLTVPDFHIAFFLAALVGVLALVDVVRLPADAGAVVSDHRRRVAGGGEEVVRRSGATHEILTISRWSTQRRSCTLLRGE